MLIKTTFQTNNGYCEKLEYTVHIDDNGKALVTFEPRLSKKAIAELK
jgi:hypothetical protein